MNLSLKDKCLNLNGDCEDCSNCTEFDPGYDHENYKFHGDSVSVNTGDRWEEWTKQNFIEAFGWWENE